MHPGALAGVVGWFGRQADGVADQLELSDRWDDASDSFVAVEGDVLASMSGMLARVQELVRVHGRTALIAIAVLYAAFIIVVVLCETARCLHGKRAIGAEADAAADDAPGGGDEATTIDRKADGSEAPAATRQSFVNSKEYTAML